MKGFTLLEVVLVSVVIVLLLAAAMPRFQQASERLRAEQTAFALTQLLRAAREQAVVQGRTVVWAWDPAARHAQLYGLATAADGSLTGTALAARTDAYGPVTPDCSLLVRRSDGQNPACEASTGLECADCSCLHFFPDGTGEAAVLQVDHRGWRYTVTIDAATGAALLASGSAAG